MRLIDADSVLKGIEELKRSPWFNRGKEIVKTYPGFQHIGYLERKEAVEIVRDLCIRQEPTVGGWVSVKDRLPEKYIDVLVLVQYPKVNGYTGHYMVIAWKSDDDSWKSDNNNFNNDPEGVVTHWASLPKPPKEEEPDV